VVAGGGHGDSPIWHRRLWIERRGLQEGALGFISPERMHLRDTLVEEFLGLRARGCDGEVDLSLTAQDAGRQRRRHTTGRRRAHVLWLVFGRLAFGSREQSGGKYQNRKRAKAHVSCPIRSGGVFGSPEPTYQKTTLSDQAWP